MRLKTWAGIALFVVLAGGLMVEQRSIHRGAGGVWIEMISRAGMLHDDVLAFPDWDKLERRASGNDALACPRGRCAGKADLETPIFTLPAAKLLQQVNALALSEARTVQTKTPPDENMQSAFRQASALFRFPDIISVEVFPVGENGSSLAIWSRSVVGRKDFGVNRARVERWLEKLRSSASGS